MQEVIVMMEGVLFDFNGTMFFDGDKHKMAWDILSMQYRNTHIKDDELADMHGRNNKQILKMLLGSSLSEAKSVALSEEKEAIYRTCCLADPACMHLVPGLPAFLDYLKKQQIPMTICSASIKTNMDFFSSVFQLARWFHLSNIVYDDGSHIDKTSMFEEGSKRIGVPLQSCMIIEDSFSGIHFANEVHAGCIIAITTADKEKVYRKLPGVNNIIFDYQNFDTSFFHKRTY